MHYLSTHRVTVLKQQLVDAVRTLSDPDGHPIRLVTYDERSLNAAALAALTALTGEGVEVR